jgi:hypothetical protein
MKVKERIFGLEDMKCWRECLAGMIGIAFSVLDGLWACLHSKLHTEAKTQSGSFQK